MSTSTDVTKPKNVNKVLNYKSCFDIIGPVMIGPSSSHTAGALAIGAAARKVFGGTPKNIIVKYYESFAETHKGHGTDFAIIGGVLGFEPNDPKVTSSIEVAESKGCTIQFLEMTEDSPVNHANTACLILSDDTHEIHLTGMSVGGGTIEVKNIELDGFDVNLDGPLPILLVINKDEKVMQQYKDVLTENDVKLNSVSRYINGDEVMFVFNLDAMPIDEVKEKIFSLNDASRVILL